MTATAPAPPFARFPSWRPGQLETVEAVAASRRRFALVTAPTGSGKSLIAAAAAAAETARPGVILTATRHLQDQYLSDFPNFAELRGIGRYPCAASERGVARSWPRRVVNRLDVMAGGTVPDNAKCAPCHDSPWKPWREEVERMVAGRVIVEKGPWVDPCPLTHDGCAYVAARAGVAAHDRPAVLNYHVWAALRSLENPRWPLPRPDVLICDEAHELETLICSLVGVTLELSDVQALEAAGGELGPLRDAETEQAAAKAARDILDGLDGMSAPTLSGLETGLDEIVGEATPEKRLRRAAERLACIASMSVDSWGWEAGSLTAQPLRAADYGAVTWGGVPRVVLMSATATEHTMAALGVEDVETVPVAAPVDETRRLVKVPEMPALNFRNTDELLPQLAERIDRIALDNSEHAGVVHCHSYRLGQALLDLLQPRVARRCITHERGGLDEGMRKHRSMVERGSFAPILISPSATTGVDFPGALARWQVVAKFPWPSFGSRIVKRRAEVDPEWPLRTAVATLAQTIGRGVRSADDWCTTWILDGAVMQGRVRAGLDRYLPAYVRSAFRRVL